MDERVMQFRVGVLVLATFIIGAVLVLLFRDRPAFLRGTYNVTIKLDSARGVNEGTPVRRRGVLIGRVTKVKLTRETVMVSAEIDNDYQLTRDEVPSLQTSLLGDAEIEFIKRTVPPTAPNTPTDKAAAAGT